MSIKSILIFVAGASPDAGPLDVALGLASSMRAVLRIVHVTPPPVIPDPVPVGMYGGLPYGGAETIDRIERIEAEIAATAEKTALDACKSHAIPVIADGAVISMGQTQALFRVETGGFSYCLKRAAATADLIVAGYVPQGDLAFVLSGLFDGRRAVLALPDTAVTHLSAMGYATSVMIAWDGSPASGRALREAVPFLVHATEVSVVQVRHHAGDGDEQDRADVIAYLRSHCIEAHFIFRESEGRKTGEILLEEAARLKAGLLVMGAYGHGHTGEMLLGGVSDHVLKHATLPLLLAH